MINFLNGISLYFWFHIFGFVAAVIYILIFSRKFEIPLKKSLPLIVLAYVTVYALMLLLFYLITGYFGGQNIIRIFIFLPFVVFYYCKALNIPAEKAMDFVSPIPCIIHGISHIGCIFEGCCFSNIQTRFGIYNPVTKTTLFPVQLLETAVALIIAGYFIIKLKRHRYSLSGKAMPEMLILFGVTRFLLEFLRDNEKLFWGISELALWALGAALLGLVWLLIKRRRRFV